MFYATQSLPWLALAALQNEEVERKERVKRLQLQKSAGEGKGFGPAPKTLAKPYMSAYSRNGSVAGSIFSATFSTVTIIIPFSGIVCPYLSFY